MARRRRRQSPAKLLLTDVLRARKDKFFLVIALVGAVFNLVTCHVVPVESVAYPLLVFKNYGGHALEHFVALPKRKCHEYFLAERIND